MARKLKPYEVDQVHNSKTGIMVKIMLDRNSNTFFGMVGPVRFDSVTAEDCKKKVRAALNDYTGLDWQPYIHIEIAGGEYGLCSDGHKPKTARVSLEFYRLYGAKTVDGTWTQKKFEEDMPGHKRHSDDDSFYMSRWYRRTDDDSNIIPYTEEAWATLHVMRGRINDIAKGLTALAERKDFAKMLSNPNKNLLLKE